ncbi:sel1 repeat family protein [Janthinobacterium sp. GW460P]|uniref:tetratricopeptide repeat protein n=1 Tax=unclassified Janthinobacterium TaxID=2610881 RepID=UPI000A31FA0F|nr:MULTISPECIES: SEL1-like repeat protein [unclassified Janthinobacterium]MCC7702299.1 sel1 repeat family protein [Janthinobacterium sp. GW460P]MCC7707807.1 sel1 repeat family protein [Janthinobacterium sp. GW460W]
MRTYALMLAVLFAVPVHAQDSQGESDLSYKAYVHSDKRIKCLYGYAADKTGDHAAAVAIFEDCIRRWNDVYSMIWLAQLYETGIGVPKDLARATALMRRGAHTNDDAAYARLARYHYGVALAEGRGTPQDIVQAKAWLRRAAQEGVREAADYLVRLDSAAP